MKQLLKTPVLHLIGLAFLFLMMGACSLPSLANGLGPLPLLGNTATAMLQVKSAHVTMTLSSTTHLSQRLSGSFPQDLIVKVTGSGVEALPQQQQMKLMMTVNKLPAVQATETLSQGKWFVQLPNQPAFEIVPPVPGSGGRTSPAPVPAPHNLDVKALLALAQHLQITDRGEENVSGMRLHHLTVALDTQAIKQLLDLAGALQNVQGKQIVDAIQSAKGTADLFINDTNSLVYRLGLAGTVCTHMPGSQRQILATTQFTAQVDLSQFNQPVTIVVPANPVKLPVPPLPGR